MFDTDSDAALAAATALEAGLPPTDTDYADLTEAQLEAKLVEAHKQSLKANAVRDKYTATIAADDLERARLKDHAYARARDKS